MSESIQTLTLTDFLLARIAEDEEAARLCAEMFPSPWDVADRGWRVRIYASDVPIEDLSTDDLDAMTTRNPVIMEVEPDRHIDDPEWLSERVEHIRRHDPVRVLVECEAKRRIVETVRWSDEMDHVADAAGPGDYEILHQLALPFSDHPDYREEWRP